MDKNFHVASGEDYYDWMEERVPVAIDHGRGQQAGVEAVKSGTSTGAAGLGLTLGSVASQINPTGMTRATGPSLRTDLVKDRLNYSPWSNRLNLSSFQAQQVSCLGREKTSSA